MQPLMPWKSRSITHSECVFVALFIQHAKSLHSIILSSVSCLALPYFSTLTHKLHDFRKKKVVEYEMGVFILSRTFLKHFSF